MPEVAMQQSLAALPPPLKGISPLLETKQVRGVVEDDQGSRLSVVHKTAAILRAEVKALLGVRGRLAVLRAGRIVFVLSPMTLVTPFVRHFGVLST